MSVLVEVNPLTVRSGKTNDMVKKTVIFLNENYKSPLDLKTIADSVGYGKFTLSHGFKSSVGM